MLKQLFASADKRRLHRSLVALTVIAVILGALTVILSAIGFFIVPLLAGIYAYVITVDTTKHRWLTLSYSFMLLGADFLVNRLTSVNSVAIIISGALIALWFIRGGNKSFFVGLSTVLLSFIIFLSLYLLAFSSVGFDFAKATEALKLEADGLREALYNTFTTALSSQAFGGQGVDISGVMLRDMINEYISMLPSVLVICALVSTAVSNAVFLVLLSLCASRTVAKDTGAFCTSPVFAVAYVLLLIFTFFESDGSAFSVALLNLYYVFMFIYAYVGFRFIAFVIGSRFKNMILVAIVLSVMTLIFSSFALQILSAVGVLETFAVARHFSQNGDNKEGGNRIE